MKKFLRIIIALIVTAFVYSPVSNASTYTLKNSNLKLPNLYSTTVAKQLKSGTYKYYGVKLGMTKKSLYSAWGKPASRDLYRGSGTTDGMYFYGNDLQAAVNASSHSTKTSEDKLIIDSITLSDAYHKYELSKVKRVFGSPTSTYTDDDFKFYSYETSNYEHSLDIFFEKVGSKWYVEEITYSKYDF